MTLPCSDHEARLLLWSSGELDADSAAASRAHAEECPSCGELLEGLDGLEAWATTSLPEFSAAFPPPRHVHALVTHRFEEGARRRPAAGWLASLLVPVLALAMVWVSPAPGPSPLEVPAPARVEEVAWEPRALAEEVERAEAEMAELQGLLAAAPSAEAEAWEASLEWLGGLADGSVPGGPPPVGLGPDAGLDADLEQLHDGIHELSRSIEAGVL